MTYGCFNRKPFEKSIRVQDGWLNSWARNMVDMEFRLDPSCVYSTSDLGQKDKGCHGCIHRASSSAGAGAPTEVGIGPDGVSGVRGMEGEGTGSEVPAGDGRSSDAAEQRRQLEKAWPGAAAYQPTEEK